MSALRTVVGVVRETLHHSFVEPVRSGRVRPAAWPRPMRVTIIAAFVVYGVLTASVLVSGAILSANPGYDDLGLSTAGWPFVALGYWATMILLFLGTLRLNVWFRLASWLLMAIPHVTALLAAVAGFVTLGSLGWLMLLGILLLALAGNVALIVLIARRSRTPLRASTAVTATAAFTVTYLIPQLLAGRLPDFAGVSLAGLPLVITSGALMVIGLPLSVAAGTAFAQIAVNLSTYSLLSLRDDVSPRIWLPLGVVLALGLGGYSAYHTVNLAGSVIVLTITQAGVALALSAAGLRLARRVGPFDVPRPTALTEELGRVSMTLGILLGSWMLPALLEGYVPMPEVLERHAPSLSDFALAIGALVMAWHAIRRGRTALATLLPSVAAMGAYAGINTWFGLGGVNLWVTNLVVLILLLGTAAFWWRRGGLTPARLFVLGVALLIMLAFPFRELVAEPVAALLGFSSVGVLLFGLIWRLLTDGEFTHTESVRLPGGARVLIFLAYALFSATLMVAFVYGEPGSLTSFFNLEELASIGDSIIGYAVLPAVIVGLIELGWFQIDVAEPGEMDTTIG